MKKIFPTLLLIISFLCVQAQEYKVASIGFYNVENLFDTLDTPDVKDTEFSPTGSKLWDSKKYEEKVGNMAYVVSQLATDVNPRGVGVLGLAEIENITVIQDLINHPLLKKRNYGIIHVDSKDFRGIDVALIYQRDIFEPTNYKAYELPNFNKDGSKRPTRDILLVSGLLDGEPIHFLVNHWPSRRGGENATEHLRVRGAQICKTIIDSLRVEDENVKAIVMGDFNDNPNNESVAGILKGQDKISKVKGDAMFNPMLKKFKKGFGSNAYRDTWSLFDQILISPALIKDEKGFFYHKAVIYSEKYLQTPSGKYKGYPKRTYSNNEFIGGYSDHFPVYIHLVKSI